MRAERVRREKMAAESAAMKTEAKGKRFKKAAAAMNSDPSGSEQQQG